jgi:trigger factor
MRQLKLTIAVDESRVHKAMQQKARELGREINMPGFRPGKAPYDVIVRRIGEDSLRAEAIEDLAQPVFEEALEQENIDPYAQPTLDDIDPKPLVYTFTVPLSPQVTLGDYRALRQEIEPVEIQDEAVDQALEYVRARHQNVEAVDRPAQPGDVIAISGSGRLLAAEPAAGDEAATAEDSAAAEDDDTTADDAETPEEETLFDEERLELLLDEKNLFPGTPFIENVTGLSAGDQKSFRFTFPDEYEPQPEYAGREAVFDVTVLEVSKRELPDLDDELAKLEGDYETLDELRASLRRDLLAEAESNAREKILEDLTDRLLEEAELVYPPAAVETQIDDMVDDFKNRLSRSGWQFTDYLNLQGLTEESLRQDFADNATEILRRRLVLRQFILDEKLRVEAADIDAQIEERVGRFANEGVRDSMRNYYGSGRGFELISAEVLSMKAAERARAVFAGGAPDLSALVDDLADEEE